MNHTDTLEVLAICGHKTRPAELRRGLCDSCYRKLLAAGCPLPPKSRRWDNYDRLAEWARTLPGEVRAHLLRVLAAPPNRTGPTLPLRGDHCGSTR